MPETPELFTRREAAERQDCSESTICNWEQRGWLTAAENPLRRAGATGRPGRRFTAEALDAAAAKAEKHLEAIRAKRRGNLEEAAGWAGVSPPTIRTAARNGELKALSKDPFIFEKDVVKRWAADQEKQEGDLAITDIPARLKGPPGKIYRSGSSEKLERIRSIIRRLEIETFRRRTPGVRGRWRQLCIRQEQFHRIEAEYLDLTRDWDEQPKPGEITIDDAAAEYKRDRGTILARLTKHAPAECVRTLKRKAKSGNRYTLRVAPRAAIEAALRGENWTPEGNGKQANLPAAEKPRKPEGIQLPEPVAASPRVQLFGPDTRPAIDGEMLPKKLTKERYALVLALIAECKDGRRPSKKALEKLTDTADPVKTLRRLAASHPKWESVIEFAGEKGSGYGIQ